jgi:HPt (histidine-containing phosphotransfer) domain-containing protein
VSDLEIWLVNDDPAQLLVQKRLLGRFAATVWDFQSPTELMAQARGYGSCPNLVSDFHMPGMNGLELSQLWCQMHPNARILLLSASALSSVEQEEATYLPSNRVKMLTNFRIPELLSVAQEWFAQGPKGEESSLETPGESAESSLEYFESSMHSKLRMLGGQAFLKKALERFANRLPERLQKLDQALASNDHRKLHHEAHSLKGSCGIVGAHQMLESADRLEVAAKAEEEAATLRAEMETLHDLWRETEAELQSILAPS